MLWRELTKQLRGLVDKTDNRQPRTKIEKADPIVTELVELLESIIGPLQLIDINKKGG